MPEGEIALLRGTRHCIFSKTLSIDILGPKTRSSGEGFDPFRSNVLKHAFVLTGSEDVQRWVSPFYLNALQLWHRTVCIKRCVLDQCKTNLFRKNLP